MTHRFRPCNFGISTSSLSSNRAPALEPASTGENTTFDSIMDSEEEEEEEEEVLSIVVRGDG